MEVSSKHRVPAALTPGERILGNHWIGGLADLRGGLDAVGKLKNTSPVGNRTQVVKSVSSRYTDWPFVGLGRRIKGQWAEGNFCSPLQCVLLAVVWRERKLTEVVP
jgi:hypothetical protein